MSSTWPMAMSLNPDFDPAWNVMLLTAGPTVGANYRGIVTSGVIDDFVGVGLRESSISELGIAGTKINIDLPRFGPLNVR